MKLIELLVESLGGWPVDKKFHTFIAQDDDGDLWAFPSKPQLNVKRCDWEIQSGDGCYLFNLSVADDNRESIINREQYEDALAASKTEWDGEGLPPVGCECELSNAVEFYTHSGSTDFEEGTAVVVGGKVNFGLGDFVAVKVKGTNCITDINPCFLRPIRSEADKNRDEAIESIQSLIEYRNGCHAKALAKWLFEEIAAGKIPHIRID